MVNTRMTCVTARAAVLISVLRHQHDTNFKSRQCSLSMRMVDATLKI